MTKTTFTAKQLEEAIEKLKTADKDFPQYPLVLGGSWEPQIWDESFYPLQFRKIGDDENVQVSVKEYFGGEEGGDHRMYIIFQVGWGSAARYFEKTGEYNSWDDSYWDGTMHEVIAQEVKKMEWVSKK